MAGCNLRFTSPFRSIALGKQLISTSASVYVRRRKGEREGGDWPEKNGGDRGTDRAAQCSGSN